MTTTAAEVGQWLMDQVRAVAPRRAYQELLVREMRKKFGPEWSYTNHNGNPAIDKGVLKEFGKLKDEFVIWDRSDQSWRIVDQETLDRMREREAEMKRRKEEWAARYPGRR